MRVYKTSYRDRQGRQRDAAKWYIEFRDHAETVRRLPAFTDKKQSEQLGRNIERLVCSRANSESPDLELTKWLDMLPGQIRDKLSAWHILDERTYAASKPLAKHVDEFHAGLVAKGSSRQHADVTRNRINDICAGCSFTVWTDLDPTKVEQHLASRRDKGLSRKSSNYYLSALQQLARWMILQGRASRSPIAHLSRMNSDVGRQERRALSVDELRRLLHNTVTGPVRFGVDGAERAVLYRLAVESGLRSNELRSLTRSSFRFDKQLATVTVEAGHSKRRRRDEVPLRPDTAEAIQLHLREKHPGAKAFELPRPERMATMIRRDLTQARAAWLNEAATLEERAERERSTFLTDSDDVGRTFDFHSLRHTFTTNLARSGVHPKVAQTLARHSTITLTWTGTVTSSYKSRPRPWRPFPASRKRSRHRSKPPGPTGLLSCRSRVHLSWRFAGRELAPKGAFLCSPVQ